MLSYFDYTKIMIVIWVFYNITKFNSNDDIDNIDEIDNKLDSERMNETINYNSQDENYIDSASFFLSYL